MDPQPLTFPTNTVLSPSQYSSLKKLIKHEPKSQPEQHEKLANSAFTEQWKIKQIEKMQTAMSQINQLAGILIQPREQTSSLGLSIQERKKKTEKKNVWRYRRLYDLITHIQMLDKIVDEYNMESMNQYMEQNLWFRFEIMAIQDERTAFVEKVCMRDIFGNNMSDYFANLVISKETPVDKYYRMHVQLYKQSAQIHSTSVELTRLQKSLTYFLTHYLQNQNYISYIQPPIIALKTKYPVHLSILPHQKSLLKFLSNHTHKFLFLMNNLLQNQRVCPACQRFKYFDKNTDNFAMPTLIRYNEFKKKLKQENQWIFFHQQCFLQFMKSDSFQVNLQPLRKTIRMRPGHLIESISFDKIYEETQI